jgi:hypothetical protein
MNEETNSQTGLLTGDGDTVVAPSSESTRPEHMSGAERDRLRARSERRQHADSNRSLPADDPSQWVGKKVRSKKTGATFVIRQVYKSNRVELEKSWMTYSSDVPAIRADYEVCI